MREVRARGHSPNVVSIGERLRLAREQQGRSLSELAEQTRIGIRRLTAIETDDAGAFPGMFYHRNFVKQYAAALALDPGTFTRDFDAMYPPQDINPLPALVQGYARRPRRWWDSF